MKRIDFPAMGTRIVATGNEIGDVVGFFADAEAVFSRFDSTSELNALNTTPGRAVEVSSALASCLADAQELRRRTGGLVDPAVGAAVAAWGYDRAFAALPQLTAEPVVAEIGEWSIEESTVFRSPGTVLDLGGIAKGWTADRTVELGLASLVSAGGDLRSAGPPLPIAIADPWGEIAATVQLSHGGLATSSSSRRRWKVADGDAHHIIDPRRLRPAASPIFSATVTAATATEAEAGAKAVLLHGEHGLVWAEEQDWIEAALVVWHDGNVYATTGWTMAA
ncbi:MAG: FAD:protein FMN transferase [Acidimicrobiia bacterium]|nr:FAD:protein FMN transferase [Acidimicrobiia bacterium]